MQLTDNIIAVEVPEDATDLNYTTTWEETTLWYHTDNVLHKKGVRLGVKGRIIGVTPLSARECAKVVEKWDRYFPMKHTVYRNYLKPAEYSSVKQSTEQGWSDCFGLPTESFDTLLESKGLDPNKKYAIIKIEKK